MTEARTPCLCGKVGPAKGRECGVLSRFFSRRIESLKQGKTITVAELIDYCRERLGRFGTKSLEIVSALPKNPRERS